MYVLALSPSGLYITFYFRSEDAAVCDEDAQEKTATLQALKCHSLVSIVMLLTFTVFYLSFF